MKKLRLVLDELRVQSFATQQQVSKARGTVHGRDSEGYMGACTASGSAGPPCFCLEDFNMPSVAAPCG